MTTGDSGIVGAVDGRVVDREAVDVVLVRIISKSRQGRPLMEGDRPTGGIK